MGVISKRIQTIARIVEKKESNHIVIKVNSVEGDLEAEIDASLLSHGDTTTLMLKIMIEAEGSFKWMINQILKSQLDGFVEEFSKCIASSKLE
jgi:carbon monoxide dehydrogenase subunit G